MHTAVATRRLGGKKKKIQREGGLAGEHKEGTRNIKKDKGKDRKHAHERDEPQRIDSRIILVNKFYFLKRFSFSLILNGSALTRREPLLFHCGLLVDTDRSSSCGRQIRSC